ncbi:MAG: head GIN domain-containing protein [Bacteroidia bacterium]
MKTTLAIICAIAIAFSAFAQKTENRPVTAFDKLEVSGAATVKLSKGEAPSVRVEADEDDLAKIITEVKNNKLIVKSKGDIKKSFKVYIAYTALSQLDVSGASSVQCENALHTDKLNINASGASSLDLALSVKELKTEASGASSVLLNGTVENHIAEVSGAATLKALKLASAATSIKASGASSARVNAGKKIKAVANGASSIHYSGSPEDAEVSSDMSSSVKKSDS